MWVWTLATCGTHVEGVTGTWQAGGLPNSSLLTFSYTPLDSRKFLGSFEDPKRLHKFAFKELICCGYYPKFCRPPSFAAPTFLVFRLPKWIRVAILISHVGLDISLRLWPQGAFIFYNPHPQEKPLVARFLKPNTSLLLVVVSIVRYPTPCRNVLKRRQFPFQVSPSCRLDPHQQGRHSVSREEQKLQQNVTLRKNQISHCHTRRGRIFLHFLTSVLNSMFEALKLNFKS